MKWEEKKELLIIAKDIYVAYLQNPENDLPRKGFYTVMLKEIREGFEYLDHPGKKIK
jgi:hypothetical protein